MDESEISDSALFRSDSGGFLINECFYVWRKQEDLLCSLSSGCQQHTVENVLLILGFVFRTRAVYRVVELEFIFWTLSFSASVPFELNLRVARLE